MYSGKMIFFGILAFFSASLSAQSLQGIELPKSTLIFSKLISAFIIDNPALGTVNDSISYQNIKGSPYWRAFPQPALIYTSKGYVGTFAVRINLATNDIYFIQGEEEMALNDNSVVKIIFNSLIDSAVFISQVPDLMLNKNRVTGFVQELNTGNARLLKYARKKVIASETPSHTSKVFYFADEFNYFLQSNEKVEFMKKLNKENLLSILTVSPGEEKWAKDNNINFKTEKDIVRFLNYHNAH